MSGCSAIGPDEALEGIHGLQQLRADNMLEAVLGVRRAHGAGGGGEAGRGAAEGDGVTEWRGLSG